MFSPTAPAKILKYMLDQNRPYSASTITYTLSTHQQPASSASFPSSQSVLHQKAGWQFDGEANFKEGLVYVENATDDHIFRPFHCPDFHTRASSLSIVDILTNLHKEFGKTVSSHWMFDP